MDEPSTYQIIAQLIGIIASAFVVLSFGQKRDNHLKIYVMIGNIIFAVHFLMLGAYAGVFVTLLNTCRAGFSIKFHKSTKMMFFFWGIYILAAVIVYEKPIDLFPFFSSILGTYSMFKLSGIKLRLLGMLGSSSWLVYGIVFHSVGGIITEISVMVLNTLTILRLMSDKKKQSNEQSI